MNKKYKIVRFVIDCNNNVTDISYLYNFYYKNDAIKRLQEIKNICRYPIEYKERTKFICNKGRNKMMFEIQKQK